MCAQLLANACLPYHAVWGGTEQSSLSDACTMGGLFSLFHVTLSYLTDANPRSPV